MYCHLTTLVRKIVSKRKCIPELRRNHALRNAHRQVERQLMCTGSISRHLAATLLKQQVRWIEKRISPTIECLTAVSAGLKGNRHEESGQEDLCTLWAISCCTVVH